MTGRDAATAVGLVVILATVACAPTPVPTAPAPPARDLVVLVPDPESGHVGRAVVTTGAGAVELTTAGATTSAAAGQAPAAVTTLTESEISALFGAVMAMRPAAARHFNLYFDTGTSTLTAASRAELTEILAVVRTATAPDVSVIGHTDTTGAADVNATLARERAASIRDQLIAVGLEASLIEVASHGEFDLLVPTPDNTAEPRNRRVEVIVR